MRKISEERPIEKVLARILDNWPVKDNSPLKLLGYRGVRQSEAPETVRSLRFHYSIPVNGMPATGREEDAGIHRGDS